jgi:hypothetical protein
LAQIIQLYARFVIFRLVAEQVGDPMLPNTSMLTSLSGSTARFQVQKAWNKVLVADYPTMPAAWTYPERRGERMGDGWGRDSSIGGLVLGLLWLWVWAGMRHH